MSSLNPFGGNAGIGSFFTPFGTAGGIFGMLNKKEHDEPPAAPAQPKAPDPLEPGTASANRRGTTPTASRFTEERKENRRRRRVGRRTGGAVTLLSGDESGAGLGG